MVAVWRFAGSADDFLMVAVTDQNNGALFAGELQSFEVNFGHQRAGSVDDFEFAGLASSRTVGGTPWALNTSTAPCGTSSMASTKMAPRRRNCSTT